jgi:hypothetical protein
MPHKIKVFHVDDEIQTVDWIPNDLFETLYARFPGRVSQSHPENDAPDREYILNISVTLEQSQGTFEILYCLMSSDEKLDQYLQADGFDGHECKIVILDAMRDTVNGTKWGLDIYKRLRALKVKEDCIVFLTAYPNELRDKLGTGSDFQPQIITKPVTALLTNVLIDRIERLRD